MTSEEEKRYFVEFEKRLEDLNETGRPSYNEKESWPDVVYVLPKGQPIAIELTELLTKSNTEKTRERKQDNLESVIRSELIRLLIESKHYQGLYFTVQLNHRLRLNDSREARRIAKIASDEILKSVTATNLDSPCKTVIDSDLLSKFKVEKISVHQSRRIYTFFGDVGSKGAFVPNYDIQEVIEIVKKKDSKIVYNSSELYSENWLVIVESESAATWRTGIDIFERFKLDTKYDRVFLFNYLFGHLLEFKTAK